MHAGSQTGITELLVEEEDIFANNTRELEDGVQGVRSALGVLRDTDGGGVEAHELQSSLGELDASQAVMTKLCAEVKDIVLIIKREPEDGTLGVRSAVGIVTTQRMRLQVRVKESFDLFSCLSLIFHL